MRAVNVKKSYDQKTLVVKDFNLDVNEGEFITLLGPSGSGKTTVLMMMAGFEDVAYGPPRHSSQALLDPKVKPYLPSTHVDVGLRADGNFWSDYGEALGERFNQWLLK